MQTSTIYLDNAASTRLDERVLEAIKPYLFDTYAVATSQFGYSLGIDAKDALDAARATVAAALGAQPDEIVFTSGDTEASNMALKGVAAALARKKGTHLITSRIADRTRRIQSGYLHIYILMAVIALLAMLIFAAATPTPVDTPQIEEPDLAPAAVTAPHITVPPAPAP